MLSDYKAEGNIDELYTPEMFEDISGYVANFNAQKGFAPPKLTLDMKQTVTLNGYD